MKKRTICLTGLLVLLAVVAGASADGKAFAAHKESPLTTAEVLATLDTMSPVLALAKAELAKVRSEYTASRALPNPRLFGSSEDLNSGRQSDKETTIGLRQDISFIWSQPSWVDAKASAYKAAQASYRRQELETHGEVVLGMTRLDNLRSQITLLDSILVKLDRLTEILAERRRLGDIAPYDEQRLQLEATQFRNRWAQARSEYQETLNNLVAVTGFPAARIENTLPLDSITVPFRTFDDALAYAYEHNPDLIRAKEQHRAASRMVNASTLAMLPGLSIGIGRKEMTGGFEGTVLEGEIELPVLNQRRSQRNLARAEASAASTTLRAAEHLTEQEVKAAFRQYQSLSEPAASAYQPSPKDLPRLNLEQSTRLFLLGEIKALELVDAMRTNFEALQAQQALSLSRLAAAIGLRRACGLPVLE